MFEEKNSFLYAHSFDFRYPSKMVGIQTHIRNKVTITDFCNLIDMALQNKITWKSLSSFLMDITQNLENSRQVTPALVIPCTDTTSIHREQLIFLFPPRVHCGRGDRQLPPSAHVWFESSRRARPPRFRQV